MKMTNYPRVGTAVLITNIFGEVLLAPRNTIHKGEYCPPGGKLDFNEKIEDCMRREVKEETGLELENLKVLPVVTRNLTEDGNHYVCFWGLSKVGNVSQTVDFVEEGKNGPKFSDCWRFYSPQEALQRLPLFGSNELVLKWLLEPTSDFTLYA